MGSKGNWYGFLTVAFLLAALSACATAQQTPAQAPPPPPPSTPPPPPAPARDDCTGVMNHNIEVGARVSCKWVFLKTNENGQGNTVNWRATDQNMGIKIRFDDTNVFQGLNCDGDQNLCQSGALNKSYKGDPSVEYRYHAYLCPGKDKTKCGPNEIDPGIIIVP